MILKLNTQDIAQEIINLPGWSQMENRHALHKRFKFKSFAAAWAFMNKIATLAEDMDHHPEWSNLYNRVEIILTTHDADGISKRDIDMATAINAFEAELKSA